MKKTNRDMTILMMSVDKGFIDIVKRILIFPEIDVFLTQNSYGSIFQREKLQTDAAMNNIFIDYFKNNFQIDFSNLSIEFNQDIPIENFIQFKYFNLLKQLIHLGIKTLLVKKAGILCDDTNPKKVCLFYFNENKIFLDLYDYEFFSNYVFSGNTCPLTNKPISSFIDFDKPKEELEKKMLHFKMLRFQMKMS